MWRSRLVVWVNVVNGHESVVPAWLGIKCCWTEFGLEVLTGSGQWVTPESSNSLRQPHQYTSSQLFLVYNRALPDAPANQNGSWILSPLGKSLAVLSVIGLAVCCQPWIFCGDWDHFCYHNGTHKETVVYFSVQYGSVDNLPWPHRH